MRFQTKNGVLIAQANGETLRIEPWGKDSLRVRATMLPEFSGKDWALTEVPEKTEAKAEQFEVDHLEIDGSMGKRTSASITNGKIRAVVNFAGVITFYKEEQEILREYHRCYDGTISKESRCLKTVNREWKGVIGGSEYSLNLKFESNDEEKIFGMGQYQQKYMDLKGCTLELAQRNSQISVPFAVSSLGYGMLWNNPAVGQVTFGKNYTEWTARSTKDMDYWLTAADTPKEILENYTAVTGRAPKFPEDRMGLWQCKLRYRTQEEVLEVARRYQKEGIKIDQIVIDFFHWTVQGDWKFDEKYWPDPKAMVDELHSMGIKVIVSVWPSVDRKSENFWPMLDRGLLIKTERGALQTYDFQGDCVEIDVFNPETRKYVWEVCKKNYYDFGIDAFWLDNSEPDFGVYDFDHYRYIDGPALSCSNIYPQLYSRVFYDGMKAEGEENIQPKFPFLCLLVSGGNSQIILVKAYNDMEILGQTIDDAAGEAIDKCSKVMGLGYPGGPIIDKLARQGNPKAYTFSKPHIPGLDYSFSGLKTSFLYSLRDWMKDDPDFIEHHKVDLAASLEATVVDILMDKLRKAAKEYKIKEVAVAGGVSANNGLRNSFREHAEKYGWNIFIPKFSYTTDNAAMIAITGYFKYLDKDFCSIDLPAYSRVTL